MLLIGLVVNLINTNCAFVYSIIYRIKLKNWTSLNGNIITRELNELVIFV